MTDTYGGFRHLILRTQFDLVLPSFPRMFGLEQLIIVIHFNPANSTDILHCLCFSSGDCASRGVFSDKKIF